MIFKANLNKFLNTHPEDILWDCSSNKKTINEEKK